MASTESATEEEERWMLVRHRGPCGRYNLGSCPGRRVWRKQRTTQSQYLLFILFPTLLFYLKNAFISYLDTRYLLTKAKINKYKIIRHWVENAFVHGLWVIFCSYTSGRLVPSSVKKSMATLDFSPRWPHVSLLVWTRNVCSCCIWKLPDEWFCPVKMMGTFLHPIKALRQLTVLSHSAAISIAVWILCSTFQCSFNNIFEVGACRDR